MLKINGDCDVCDIPFLQAYLLKDHGIVASLEEVCIFWEIFSRKQYNQTFIKIQGKIYEDFAEWLLENVSIREIEGRTLIRKEI